MDLESLPVLSLIMAIPFCGALLLLLIPSRYDDAVRYVAMFCGSACFLLSLLIFVSYDFTLGDLG